MQQNQSIKLKDSTFIRAAIAKSLTGSENLAARYAEHRWGADSKVAAYTKAAVASIVGGVDTNPQGLEYGTISRSEFVQAVFSASILGKMQGIIEVPALTRINAELSPVAGAFVPEGQPLPVAAGNFGVYLADKRKAGLIAVLSRELLECTDDSAEATITSILVRGVSRAIDNALLGSQVRDDTAPQGLSNAATQIAAGATANASFNSGVEAFMGDITRAYLLVNPLTAITLRSPQEQVINARGGFYGGLPVITSYGVPAGQLFIVDASRVLAYIGDAAIDRALDTDIYGMVGYQDANGATSMYSTSQIAVRAVQYADWQLIPGAAVQTSVSAS